jgi:hypothetical protein
LYSNLSKIKSYQPGPGLGSKADLLLVCGK